MQVPVLNRTVEQNPTLLNTPQISKAIPGAFGEAPAEALEKLGAVGVQAATSLTGHLLWQQYQKSMDQVYEAHTKLSDTLKDKLYSTDMQPVKNTDGTNKLNPDGSVMEQPIGIMNRQGFGATGSALEVRQAAENLQKQVASTLPGNPLIQRTFARYATSTVDSVYNAAVEHEAKEWRKGSLNLKNSAIQNQINQSELAQTPQLLSASIDNVAKMTNELADFSDLDDETRQKKISSTVQSAIQKAVLGTLNKTGKIDDAHNLLDSVKDKIPGEVYDVLDERIDKSGEQLQLQLKRQVVVQKVSTRFNYLDQLSKGQLGYDDLHDLATTMAPKDPKLSEVFQMIAKKQQQGNEYKGQDRDFTNAVNNVFNADTQEQISEYLMQMLKENPNMSQDHLATIINAGINRSKTMPLTNDNFGDGKFNSQQNDVDNSVRDIQEWSKADKTKQGNTLMNFFKVSTIGKSTQVAHDEAIRQSNITANPQVLRSPEKGQWMMDAKGNKAIVYPDGHFEEIADTASQMKRNK